MNKDIKLILNYLHEKRGSNFSGYRTSMVERRVQGRFSSTKCKSYNDYLNYLQDKPAELDNLLDVLTINVSRFFRDTLAFEYLADRVIPSVIHSKKESSDRLLRVWSAGCAMGEEPYSIAILIHDFFEKDALDFQVHIFATDVDGKILKKAQKASYPFESVKSIKYRLLKKYFDLKGESFQLIPEIKERVSFSLYDILDKKSHAPPESIYGNFDVVLCRNVLIYFDADHQDRIFNKLYLSLAQNGYLILGEAEIPPRKYQGHFQRVNECCHIYRKI